MSENNNNNNVIDVNNLSEQEIDDHLNELEFFDSISASSLNPVRLIANNLSNVLVGISLVLFIGFSSACDIELLGIPLFVILFRLVMHSAVCTYKVHIADFILILITFALTLAATQFHTLGAFQFVAAYTLLIIPDYAIKAAYENYSSLEHPWRVRFLKLICTTMPHFVVCGVSIALTKGGFFFNALSVCLSLSIIVLVAYRALQMTYGISSSSTLGEGDNKNSREEGEESNTTSAVDIVEDREELQVNEEEDQDEGQQIVKINNTNNKEQQEPTATTTNQLDAKMSEAARRLKEKKQKLEQKLSDRSPFLFNLYRKLANYNIIPVLFFGLVLVHSLNVTTFKQEYVQVPYTEKYLTQVKVPISDDNDRDGDTGNEEVAHKQNGGRGRYDSSGNNNNNNQNQNNNNGGRYYYRGPSPASPQKPRYRWESRWGYHTAYKTRPRSDWRKKGSLRLLPALLLFTLEALLNVFFSMIRNFNALTSTPMGLFNVNRVKRLILLGIAFLFILPVTWPTFSVGFILAASMPFMVYRDSLGLVSAPSSSSATSETNQQQNHEKELLYEKIRTDFIVSFLVTGFTLHHLPGAKFNFSFFMAMVAHAAMCYFLFRNLGSKLF